MHGAGLSAARGIASSGDARARSSVGGGGRPSMQGENVTRGETMNAAASNLTIEGVNDFPLGAQIGVGVGTTAILLVILMLVGIVLKYYRRRRNNANTNYVPFDENVLDADDMLPNARLSTKVLPGGLSQNSSAASLSSRKSLTSVESAIEAPEIAGHETVGGSGVGFLDERGIPIVLVNTSIAEQELDQDVEEVETFGDDDYR